MPGGTTGGTNGQTQQMPDGQTSGQTDGQTGGMPSGMPSGMPGGMPGGMGGEVDEKLADAVSTNAGNYTWVAASIGAQTTSGLQLETGEAVMAIGGFNGSTNSISLEQFKEYVANGEIHYFISGGMGGMAAMGDMPGMPEGAGGSSDETTSGSKITDWVEENFTKTTIGSSTVYDLTEAS